MTKLNGALPKSNEDDGLSSLNRALVQSPKDQHVVIMIVDCKTTTTDVDSGFVEATARVLRIEPITKTTDRWMAEEMLAKASDRRNGRVPIPGIDLSDVKVTVNGQDIDQ